MAQFEGNQVYFTDQNFRPNNDLQTSFGELQRAEALAKCRKFIREFQTQDVYLYRQSLIKNAINQLFYLEVEVDDIRSYDDNLYQYLQNRPSDIQSLFEESIKICYCDLQGLNLEDAPEFQLQLISLENPRQFRELNSSLTGLLVTVEGIIVSVTKTSMYAKPRYCVCKNCNDVCLVALGDRVPRLCQSKIKEGQQEQCPIDSYVIIPEKSSMVDLQTLRIQENPEAVPTGEIPRNFPICCDRWLVDKLMPGQRVVITGIYSVFHRPDDSVAKGKNSQTSQLKTSYIDILGYQLQSKNKHQRGAQTSVSQGQMGTFIQLAKLPNLYKTIVNSIAPAIYGHEDVKLALACLLFGGSSKTLPDGMKLRGDINVLLVGDPSTAKSQLLKFIERVSDISVYTSGKGSSAAGLTASVTSQGNSGQFTLEAGALVLASGGVCCIDEFDKMRPEDRVVMHEAMEQQTISIAKAGITTRLNAKCSILAAANPIFGRYQEDKGIQDQIELQTTILSRFDCIFIVKDKRTKENDQLMADHIINIHTGKMEEEGPTTEGGSLGMDQFRSFLKYARSLQSPRLSAASAQLIENLYVQDRQKSVSQVHHKQNGGKSHIPITVRQLEAIIRLSESLAKMQLKSEVDENHVKEAHRLFQNSTMLAISLGSREFGLDLPSELRQLVPQIEDSIKRRMPIGSKVPYTRVRDELVARFNNIRAVEFTIRQLVQSEDFSQVEAHRTLQRNR